MDRFEWIFLPVVIILVSLGDVLGSCDPTNPCPPPFPDFMAIFSETLKNIPELRVTNWTSLHTECPTSVNWTEFNSRLEAGDPIPLDPVCNRPKTPIPTGATQSSPNDVSSTSFGVLTPTRPPSGQSSTETGPAVGNLKESGDSRDIGMPVGIGVGAAVLVLIILCVVVAVVVRRRKAKAKPVGDYLRNQSTTSHDILVVPELDIPDTPQIHQTVVKIPGFTCEESSTDASIRRPTARVAVVVIENKLSDEMDPKGLRGCDNKAFDAAEEDLEDPGYAGSEACQEKWENEWNNKFEEALMESNENLPQDALKEENGEIDSDSQKQKPKSRTSILSNTSKDSSPTKPESFPLSSPFAKAPPDLKLNLPSSTNPTAFPVGNSSPTKIPSSPLRSPSTKKHPALKFNLPSPIKPPVFPSDESSPTKPPTSPFNHLSLTTWPPSGVDQAATPSKPSFDQGPPSVTLIPDAPPAYSSPIVKPNGTRPFSQTKPRDPSMHPTPPATPPSAGELPTYTEVMASRGAQSSSRPGPNSPPKQQRPTPPKRIDLSGTVSAPGPILLKSQPVESSAQGNSNPWKVQAKRSSKATGEPEKPANTAVVRPWTGSAGPTPDRRQSALPSTPATVTANPPSATEEAPSDSVGEYSLRPVRSLLNQFEAVNKNNP